MSRMMLISSLKGLCDWIAAVSPANVYATHPGKIEVIARELQTMDHPPYGEDWGAWLDENAERIALRVTSERLYAAIGSDGMRPVVWGTGRTEEEALDDASGEWAENVANGVTGSEPKYVAYSITAEMLRQIKLGYVDAVDLGIVAN